jgi:hypothetical protein
MLRSLKIIYGGHGYGHVLTTALPTANDATSGKLIRVELCEMPELAQLWCDVFDYHGQIQPWLELWERRNLARWILRYGVREYGRSEFAREAARRWLA